MDTERSENKKDLYQNTRKTTTNSIQANNKQQMSKYKNVKTKTDKLSLCVSACVCIRAILVLVQLEIKLMNP